MDNAPSLQRLQMFVDNDLQEQALSLIKEHKLPYAIEGGRVFDKSDLVEHYLSKFITHDEQMVELKYDVRKLTLVNDEVLITGETGTGKELIARALHGNRQGTYRAINCAGIPETLIESILFGYTQGAFTGAIRAKVGLCKDATNGTLFLDEVGELSLSMQAKLLRMIQEKVVTPLGSNSDVEINCRIVCATNVDLRMAIEMKQFRGDLYARISTFELKPKPLSARKCDIIPIIKSLPGGLEYIINKGGEPIDLNKLSWIDDLDITYNVRSLQQIIKRYQVLGRL